MEAIAGEGRPGDRQKAATRIVLRPIGTPLPLGFLGLVVATTALAALQLGWLAPEQSRVVALGVLGFTVPVQLISSLYGFLARDSVAGTGMGVLTGTWAVTGVVLLTSPPGSDSPALGVLLLTAGAAMLVPAVAGASKPVAAGVMALAGVRFAVTGLAEATASSAWETTAGAVGLVLAALAYYAALGFEVEDAHHRTVLPLLRRSEPRTAVPGGAIDRLDGVAHEAGVRAQL